MCGYGSERRVKVWVLDHKSKKKKYPYFLLDCYEPETTQLTVYQFHRCHWEEHNFIKFIQ